MSYRLTELNPRWRGSATSTRTGLSFDCPCPLCAEEPQRLGVDFANPVDGGTPSGAKNRWQRTGDSFETLTLDPSIDSAPHWHGRIIAGEMVGGLQRK